MSISKAVSMVENDVAAVIPPRNTGASEATNRGGQSAHNTRYRWIRDLGDAVRTFIKGYK